MFGMIIVVAAIVFGGAHVAEAYPDYQAEIYPRYEVVEEKSSCLALPIECQMKIDSVKEAFPEELEDC